MIEDSLRRLGVETIDLYYQHRPDPEQGGCDQAQLGDRLERPVVAYGVLEILVGAYALAFPAILPLRRRA